MHISSLLLLVFLTLVGSRVVAQSQLDTDHGILGYRLGDHQDSIKTLLKDGKSERLVRMRPIDDSLRIEGILTQKVRLFFWERTLHSIDVKVQGAEADKLLVWLKARYGEGEKLDAMGFRFRWQGKSTLMEWDQNLVTRDATLTLRDEAVHRKYYKYMMSLQ